MNSSAVRDICIHGHFYQPPRENPWLETIEQQDSAYPFHDWNQRILAECYRPNAAARIVDRDGRIISIANNYERISFNFGPTLLSWMEREAPDVYQAILDADRASSARFSGHGSAMAQVYNHIIMPLANRRDKITQVRWGIQDFERRFGRAPEGMWLAETAVDLESLDIMAEHGVLFTILAPGQATRVRPIDPQGQPTGDWQDVSHARIESGHVYRARTPSGRHIDVFFYHGQNSSAVAFDRLLENGVRFASQLAAHTPSDFTPMLSHIATDGETYGHHHRHGDMALAYALHHIDQSKHLRLTNYGEFRSRYPARYEVEILENSAWSCAHGVGRWSDDCGCRTEHRPGWNQRWRASLRYALDQLRDRLIVLFEGRSDGLLADPWRARDNYITVIADRSEARITRFLSEHAARELSPEETRTVLQLLEMQRHALLMYTSCAWFFDDFTGPEGQQVLQYAARAIELAEVVSGEPYEEPFLKLLERAQSNRPEYGNGRLAYDKLVRPAKVDLRRVVAHYAISSLFDHYGERERLHCYDLEAEDLHVLEAGKAKLAVGTVNCTSTITRATSTLSFSVLHLGDHNVSGGVRHFEGQEAYRAMADDLREAFSRADLITTQRRLDGHFRDLTFSLDSLFPDHRRRILERILEVPLAEAEAAYGHLYAHHAPLMNYLTSLDLPIPQAFQIAAQFILKLRLRRALQQALPDLNDLRANIKRLGLAGVEPSDPGLDHLWRESLECMSTGLIAAPDDLQTLETLTGLAELVHEHKLSVDLWHTQNQCYKLRQSQRPVKQRQAYDGNLESARWLELSDRLCQAIGIAPVIPNS